MKIELPKGLIAPPSEAFKPGKEDQPYSTKLDALITELGLQTQHGKLALSYALKGVLILDKKQQDYGPHNIAKFGTPGVIIRLSDKIERLINLQKSKRRRVRNESIQDTMQDIQNYAVIAQMLEDNNWPLT